MLHHLGHDAASDDGERCSAKSSSPLPSPPSSVSCSERPRPAVRRPSRPRHRDRELLSWSNFLADPRRRSDPGETVAGEVVAGAALTPERLGPILAPFEDADAGLAIAVEDAEGAVIASAGSAPSDAPVESIAEIRCGPGKAMVGRVVGRGSGPLVGPVVMSLAASLAELAGPAHEHLRAAMRPTAWRRSSRCRAESSAA